MENNQAYINLAEGEKVVAAMASRIYAARLQAGLVPVGGEQEGMRFAVREAVFLAQETDRVVSDADEEGKTLLRS